MTCASGLYFPASYVLLMVDPRLRDPEYFIARLSAKLSIAGLSVSPEANVQAVRVLSHLPSGVSLDELGQILASVYAKDEYAYNVFMQVWNELIGRAERERLEIPRGDSYSLSDEAVRRILERLAERIGQRSFAPPSVDAILEYGVRKWKSR